MVNMKKKSLEVASPIKSLTHSISQPTKSNVDVEKLMEEDLSFSVLKDDNCSTSLDENTDAPDANPVRLEVAPSIISKEILNSNSEQQLVFKCDDCDHSFVDILDLNSHIESSHVKLKLPINDSMRTPIHPEEPTTSTLQDLTCRNCEFEGCNEEDLKKHMECHITYKCEVCDFGSKSNLELQVHVK